MLDAKNRVIREERISEGALTAALVHPREVFTPAIGEAAAGLVLVHNHPSGDPEPSQEDHDVTARLCAVGSSSEATCPITSSLATGATCRSWSGGLLE